MKRSQLFLGGVCLMLGLTATASAGGVFIYALGAQVPSQSLFSFNSATPGTTTSVTITGLQPGETLVAIDFRTASGQLYGLGTTSRFYLINQFTGVATQVGSAGAFTLSGTFFGFDFNPTVDRIRVVSDADQNIRLNPNDGTLTATDTALAYAAGDPNAGQNPNVVGSAYTNNFSAATTTTLFGIDSNLDVLVRQGSADGTPVSPSTGQLFTVGALGVNTDARIGFDVAVLFGTAFASLTPTSGSVSSLYTINLATGAATLVGQIGGGITITDISVDPQGAGVTVTPTFPIPQSTPTPTPTNSPIPPTSTATATPTNSPVPPTSTATASPTSTPTPTVTSTPTSTTTPTATATSVIGGGGPAPGIPTLSGWVMGGLALLLGWLGLLAIRSGSAGS